MISDISDGAEIDGTIGNAIKALWNDNGIKETWKRRSEYQIVESVKYYFNEIDRIMKPEYVATQQDMLLARVRTTGIVTEKYVIDGKNFEMYEPQLLHPPEPSSSCDSQKVSPITSQPQIGSSTNGILGLSEFAADGEKLGC